MSRYDRRPPLELTERHQQWSNQQRPRHRPPGWRPRIPTGYLAGLGLVLVVMAVVSVLLAYVGVTLYHLSNGFDFGSALVGGTRDARMLAACWQDMGLVQEFVERQAFLGRDPAVLAQMLGDDPYTGWCR